MKIHIRVLPFFLVILLIISSCAKGGGDEEANAAAGLDSETESSAFDDISTDPVSQTPSRLSETSTEAETTVSTQAPTVTASIHNSAKTTTTKSQTVSTTAQAAKNSVVTTTKKSGYVVHITELKPNNPTGECYVGGTFPFKLQIIPSNSADQSVTWSGGGSAASLDQTGRVTGIAPGSAEIKAVANDGGITAKMTVIVMQKNYANASIIDECLRLVNEERAKGGLQPVTLNPMLNRNADVRANEIITLFSHTRPDGTSAFDLIKQQGYRYALTGENLAMGGELDPKGVMKLWMDSPGHRANIMNPEFEYIGIGYVVKDGIKYWTQLFMNFL